MTEINIFPKFIDKALSPVAESAGETLRSVWDIAFGGIDIYSQKKNLSRQKALESFKNDIDNKVSKIPLDKITEPELYIVGPTLEASKFYFENETLRELFANLIAASVNSDLHKRAHPSFVEIIKQLSSDEALMLKQMDNSPYPVLGIDFRKIGEQGIGKSTYIRDFNTLVYEVGSAHPDNGRAYLRNLDRLGLITIQEEVFLMDDNLYSGLINHQFIQDCVFKVQQRKYEHIFVKYSFQLSELGYSFKDVCIKNI